MRLWHSTDQNGRDGILASGFFQPDPPEGPAWASPDRGRVWFAISKEVARQTSSRSGWWVWVDVPDGTQQYEFDDGQPFSGNYSLDIDYVNGLALNFEEGD